MRPGIGAVLPRAALHAHRRGAGDAREPARQRAEAAAHRRAVPRGQPRLVRAPGLSRRGGARAGADPGCGPRVRAYARRATRGHPGRAPLACGARGAQRSDAARPCRLCASTLKVPRLAAHWLAAAHAATHRIHRSGQPSLPLAQGCPPWPEESARGALVPRPKSPIPPPLATQGVRRTETWDLFVSELEAHGLTHADCTAEAHAAMEAAECLFWCAADEVARVRVLEVRWPEHRTSVV